MFEFLQESVYENDMIFIENGISTIEDCRFAFESAETYDDVMVIQESLGSAVQSVFQRIADAFQKIIQALKDLFTKDKSDELAKQLKENPNAAKQKVKAADQKKLNKLYDDAVKKVQNGEDPEKVQSWFKKNAKAIAVTAAVSVSAAALLLVQNKNHKEALAKVESRAKEAEEDLEFFKKVRRNERKGLEREIDRINTNHNAEINNLNSQHAAEISSMQAKHEADLAKVNNRKKEEIKKIRSQVEEANAKCDVYTRKISGLEAQINKLVSSGNADKAKINSLTNQLNTTKSQLSKTKKDKDKLAKGYDRKVKELKKLGWETNNVSADPAKRAAQSAKAKANRQAEVNRKSVLVKDAKAKEDAIKHQTTILNITKEYQKYTSDITHDNERLIMDAIKGTPLVDKNGPVNNIAIPNTVVGVDNTTVSKAQKRKQSNAVANQFFRNGGKKGGRGRAMYSSADDLIYGSDYLEYGYDEDDYYEEDYDDVYDEYTEYEDFDDYLESSYEEFSDEYDSNYDYDDYLEF